MKATSSRSKAGTWWSLLVDDLSSAEPMVCGAWRGAAKVTAPTGKGPGMSGRRNMVVVRKGAGKLLCALASTAGRCICSGART